MSAVCFIMSSAIIHVVSLLQIPRYGIVQNTIWATMEKTIIMGHQFPFMKQFQAVMSCCQSEE